ncbi:hypothetical protein F5Y10DRAFT_241722 [Nemania abortiva]|nr:hypothetical protein F5Y10DRAFT_241722 [Nemania abortiva]
MRHRRSPATSTIIFELVFSFLFAPGVSGSDRTCYFPDGSEDTNSVPCTSDVYTHCCGTVDICLSNGYCLNAHQPYALSRGSCTDSSWGSNCSSHCHGSNDGVAGGITVANIGYDAETNTSTYCCGYAVADNGTIACANSENSFTLPAGEPILGTAGLSGVVAAAETSTSSSSISSSSSSASCIAPAALAAASSGTAAVGAGVGVSLGALLVASLAWGFLERRRRLRGEALLAHHQQQQQYPGSEWWKQPGSSPGTELEAMQRHQELQGTARAVEMMDTQVKREGNGQLAGGGLESRY